MLLSQVIETLQEQLNSRGDIEVMGRDALGACHRDISARHVQFRNGVGMKSALVLESKGLEANGACESCGWSKGHSTWCPDSPHKIEENVNAAKSEGSPAPEFNGANQDASRYSDTRPI